jgi:hypothetical protein
MRIDPHVCYALNDGADQIELLRATSNAALDIIALTGIGSIKSFDAIQRDYDKLILLEKAGILSASDGVRLTLHRELRTRSTILPGFTATSGDGLIITALFPAETTTISIETILQHLAIGGTDGTTKTTAGVICALINAANGIAVAHPTSAADVMLVKALISAGQLHAIDRAIDGIDNICVLGGSGATDIESIGAAFSEVTLSAPTFDACESSFWLITTQQFASLVPPYDDGHSISSCKQRPMRTSSK